MWRAMADGLLFIGVPVGDELNYGMAGLFAVVAALIPYTEKVNTNN